MSQWLPVMFSYPCLSLVSVLTAEQCPVRLIATINNDLLAFYVWHTMYLIALKVQDATFLQIAFHVFNLW